MTAAADRLRQRVADATPGKWSIAYDPSEGMFYHGTQSDDPDARLMALAPELATLAADMGEIIASLAASGDVRSQDLMARLARLAASTSRQEHG